MRHIILLALLLALPAHAKKPETPAVPKVPSIEEVVAAEGFTPTPSQSEIYRPGAVLVPNGRGGHDVVVEACIEAEPSVSIMSQSSIATTLAGGVSARLGVARGAASAGVEKRLSFVDPEQRTIPLAKLRPTDSCADGVQTAANFQDLSRAIVLHDVLVAIIKNTVCTKADASGGVVTLGAAEAAAFSECVQESDGQVPLGYKAVPLDKVLALASAPPESVPPTVPTRAPSAPSAATTTGGFGGMGTLDVDARLKEQACQQTAQEQGAAARARRLQAAERDLQAQATSAWQGVAGDLEKCVQLPRAERGDCIATAKQWLSAAGGLSAALEKGSEMVQTACGPREAAFPAESRQVTAREVGAAKALLAKLQSADAVVAPGAGGGAVSAGKAGIEWVSLGRFELSKTEVTVAQYRACVDAGACSKPDTGGSCNWGQSGRDQHPINCVDWNQATTFAKWAGGRLPTGEEWSYAATSGGKSWDYPWGNETATCDRAIMNDGERGCGQGGTWPVCSKPAGNSTQGVCDLAGNVWEWTDERKGASSRVFRGGGWGNDASYVRASDRARRGPSYRNGYLGFRLARTAE